MAENKRSFRSLFQKKGKKDAALLAEALNSEYGLTISEVQESAEELLSRGYHKMTETVKLNLQPMLQHIPGFAASHAIIGSAKIAFTEATQGTFTPLMQNGMQLLKAKNGSGNVRGLAMNKLTKARDIPEWVANNAEFRVSSAPQVALGVFSAMSYVTGQYFLSEINKKLTTIDSGVHEILQLLIDLQINDLQAYGQELEDISKRSQFLMASSEKQSAALQQLHQIQHQSQSIINLMQNKITAERNTFSTKDKTDVISQKLEKISEYMLHYHYALHIYSTATLLELQISGTMDTNEMELFRQQIIRRTDEFKVLYDETTNGLLEYLNQCSVLNKRQFKDYVFAVGGAAFVATFGRFAGLVNGIYVGKKIDDTIMNKKRKLKESQYAIIDRYIQELNDTTTLDAPAQAIAQYIEATRNGIEIIHMNGEYYTNMPVPETISRKPTVSEAYAAATC